MGLFFYYTLILSFLNSAVNCVFNYFSYLIYLVCPLKLCPKNGGKTVDITIFRNYNVNSNYYNGGLVSMSRTISKKRKVLCIAGGVSCFLLSALAVLVMAFDLGSSEEVTEQKVINVGTFLASLALAIIQICDIMSVFSEKFRNKLESVESKYKLVAFIEVAILILAISSVIYGVLGLSIIFIFVGLFGGDVILYLIAMLLFALILVANMIMILRSKFDVIKNKPNIYPQGNYYTPYNQQTGNGYNAPGSYNPQSGNFNNAPGSYNPQSGNFNNAPGSYNPQSGNGYNAQGSNNP